MINTYAKAYTEVLEILSHLPEEEYSKIPKEKIKFYEDNMDRTYDYKINSKVDLSEQYISKEANAILISLFRDYFATENQRNVLKKLLKQNQLKIDESKMKEFNPDDIFNNNF